MSIEPEDIDTDCSTCDGTGEIEQVTSVTGPDYGYNTVVEGTGKFKPCPDCQKDFYDQR